MSTTTIRQILGDRPLHQVSPGMSLRDAARLMAENRVGAVLVTEAGRIAGVLSERDIVFRAVAPGLPLDTTAIGEVMTREPVVVEIDASVSDALAAKLGEAFRHLPVVDGDRPVGLLSYRDIPAEYVMLYERFREMSGARADEGL